MSSRKADPATFSRVIIMQRLHEGDLAGFLEDEGDYEVLKLPMRYEKSYHCVTSIGGDRRTEEGDLLCPDRFPEEAVKETEKEMGSMTASAQLQQRPSPQSGSIIKREWMQQRFRDIPSGSTIIHSWDCAFKNLDTSSYVVGQLWAMYRAQFFLIDEIRDHMDIVATIQAIEDSRQRRLWRDATSIVIEDKANGTAVISMLKKKITRLVEFSPGADSKEARAQAVAPLFEAGNVFLPEKSLTGGDVSWVGAYVEELHKFPMGNYDDRVDATTQALLYLEGKNINRFKQAFGSLR
jgi:predicted phage terminase large subunit-like protein